MIGLSARALAASAKAGGFAPLAADLFGDLDLGEVAEARVQVDGGLDEGFAWEPLIAGLDRLAADRAPIGVVCGTGFEDRPALLDRLAERWDLIGNAGEATWRAKNPQRLAALCAELGIPHPRISFEPQPAPRWLAKQAGGSGGSHVGGKGREGVYWQERVAGDPVSALVLGSGMGAIVLGLSRQWADPSLDAPFRYGGAVRPAELPRDTETEIESAAESILRALGLVGLNSVDFLVGPEGWHLLEVNPRPGATLDIFGVPGISLFALHVAACEGDLPAEKPPLAGAAAARIVYARRTVEVVPEFDWPDWTADRQSPGTRVPFGAPLCSVLAQAASPANARALVAERGEQILAALGGG